MSTSVKQQYISGKLVYQQLKMFPKVNYSRNYGTGSIMAPWTNVMTNIPAVPPEELVLAEEDSSDDKRPGPSEMFRPEQKAITWIMDLVQKFSKSEPTIGSNRFRT